MALRAHPTIMSNLTPEKLSESDTGSSLHNCQATQISPYNIGSQQGPYSRRSRKISRRPATMLFNLLRSPQKWLGHAYTPNNPFSTQFSYDSTRQLLQLFHHWPHWCQHHQHQWHPQPIVLRQIKQCTPQRNLSHSYISPLNRTLQWCRNFILVPLHHQPRNHRRRINTNLISPPFQNGTVHHQRPHY